jgi:uncharacterized membrane protein YeaQ/YmgE (transglycosylase-associated protein family)
VAGEPSKYKWPDRIPDPISAGRRKIMVALIIWLILGFVVGYIAKLIFPRAVGGGIILTTLLGIVGAVVGGYIGDYVGYPMISSFDNIAGSIPSFISSIIGAVVVLAVFQLISGRRAN